MAAQLIKIGRSEQNDIVINDASISRFHLELFQDDEGNVFITDLGSTNGSTVNGTPLKDSKILMPNDIVKLGTASPIPWQNYFSDLQVAAKEDSVSKNVMGEIVKSNSNNWILYGAIGTLVALVVVFGFLYSDSFAGKSEDASSNDNKSPSETSDNRNGNNETVVPNKDNKSYPPKKKIPLPTNNSINYDFSCMDNSTLNDMSDLEVEVIEAIEINVSVSDEMEVGQQLYDGCQYEYNFLNGSRLNKLKEIKRKLVAGIRNPRGFNYHIYLIEATDVNAFTAGGYIFVTTGMYDYAQNEDELACVIGHEIAHNECKHINYQLKKQMALRSILGEYFDSASEALDYFLTTPFNQKKETECDFYGIDYAVTAGYNSCKVINLWTRMSEGETETDIIDGIMRTHPYSSKRSECCRNHIEANYNFSCN
ncbi:MAG: M48 family metalloprotease [Crocinitomicaceae bacterium]